MWFSAFYEHTKQSFEIWEYFLQVGFKWHDRSLNCHSIQFSLSLLVSAYAHCGATTILFPEASRYKHDSVFQRGGGAHCRSTITHLSLKMAPNVVEILWGQKYCSPIEVGCSCTMTPHFDIIVIFTLYNIWSIERLNERNHKNILQCWKWDEILP